MNIFNAVDFTADNPGAYKFELFEKFHSPELTLRDGDKIVARVDGGSPRLSGSGADVGFIARLNAGKYRVIIEDDMVGGDWRLVTTYMEAAPAAAAPAPAPAPASAPAVSPAAASSALAQKGQPTIWRPFAGVPPGHSVPMGVSAEGSILYLVRTVKDGVTSIGYLDPLTGKATLYGANKAVGADSFEVWGGGGQWVDAVLYNLPANALSAGTDANGKPIPILRERVRGGSLQVPVLYVPVVRDLVAYAGGQRVSNLGFLQCLVPDWASARDGGVNDRAFKAGADGDRSALAVLRIPQGGSLQPGKFRLADRQGYISSAGKEVAVDVGNAQLFVGTGVWAAQTRDSASDMAIPAGYDDDGSPLYVIRTKQNGADVIGKYSEKRNEALIPYGGKELKVTSFEVLCYPPPGAK